MAVKNSMHAIALTSIDSATLSGSYQVVNSSGLSNACSIVRLVNASNVGVTVSYDGSTDNDYLRANSDIQLSFQANSQPSSAIANLSKNTHVYVKGSAGTGLIYLSGYYQSSGA